MYIVNNYEYFLPYEKKNTATCIYCKTKMQYVTINQNNYNYIFYRSKYYYYDY